MIRIFLGNLGSGKSVSAIRELVHNPNGRTTYTNIITKGIQNVVTIKPQDIIKKIGEDKKPSFDLNIEYWNKQKKPLNILWDEIHLTANSRMSMSKINMVLSRFIAMARRITGFDKRGYGSFTFVAQKERTIDVNIRDLTNEIVYHISHWVVECEECGTKVLTNSESPQMNKCVVCSSWKLEKKGMFIEKLSFSEWDSFYAWSVHMKGKFYDSRQRINDIEDYFKYYDTMQIENVWENYLK